MNHTNKRILYRDHFNTKFQPGAGKKIDVGRKAPVSLERISIMSKDKGRKAVKKPKQNKVKP